MRSTPANAIVLALQRQLTVTISLTVWQPVVMVSFILYTPGYLHLNVAAQLLLFVAIGDAYAALTFGSVHGWSTSDHRH
jgi:hypothetical protein